MLIFEREKRKEKREKRKEKREKRKEKREKRKKKREKRTPLINQFQFLLGPLSRQFLDLSHLFLAFLQANQPLCQILLFKKRKKEKEKRKRRKEREEKKKKYMATPSVFYVYSSFDESNFTLAVLYPFL